MEPLEICKSLTERANAAGGHDNITVIIVQFDGPTLKEDAPRAIRSSTGSTSPPTRREETKTAAMTAPNRAASPRPPTRRPRLRGPRRILPPSGTSAGARDHDYDRVDIPGTHVPIWMVVGIVTGVIVLLAGTAFLLLRP